MLPPQTGKMWAGAGEPEAAEAALRRALQLGARCGQVIKDLPSLLRSVSGTRQPRILAAARTVFTCSHHCYWQSSATGDCAETRHAVSRHMP